MSFNDIFKSSYLENVSAIDIPDMIMRVVGVIDLIAVAALAFTTVLKLKNRDK